jgi:glutamine amidotransferase
LLVQSRRDLSGFEHADGWGIAAYRGAALQVQRRASAAHDGHYFCAAAERVEATTVLAHVRRATVGRVGLANTHPFVHGSFALVHNGTVPYFADIRPRLLDAMAADHRAAIRGGTDSEHLLHLILSRHAQLGGSLFAGLEAALRHVIALCAARSARSRIWGSTSCSPTAPAWSAAASGAPSTSWSRAGPRLTRGSAPCARPTATAAP